MAEPRRVEFQTISSAKEEKKEKKPPPVPRFTLALGESTATTCPEFSFTELLKKGKASASELDDVDAFGGEDDCRDEVAALAKKFEEKYGPKPGKKRKLKCLEDEYFDLGDGYDENDPFIDNTEAYDEVVPSCLTTKHGGFYINRGTLDFRTLSDQDDSAADFQTPLMKKRGRPRKILDSDEDEPEESAEPKKKTMKKKKLKEGGEGEQKKKKRKIALGPDGEKSIKRKKVINPDKKKKVSPTVKELLKQHTASTANHGTVNGSTEVDNSPAASPSQDRTPTVQDRIETVVFDTFQDGDDRKSEWTEFGQNQLPADLPAELGTAIIDIKQAAKDSKEGKCKFFSPHVNKLLLDIELASRQLAFGKRKSIYAHLADHLPCGKETLIKRAKKLRENQQDDQVKLPIQRLKEEIDKLMPALQEQHEQDVAKSRQEYNKKLEGSEPQKEEGVNTESDDEDKSTTPGVTEGQSRKGNRDPRKKFKWTSEVRSLLCQIVGIKMRMFDTYKFRNQTAEEYLKTFLENEVKVLWPQGWIQTRMLYKETRSVHGNWTNPLKPKRPLLVPKSMGSPTPNHPMNSCDAQANDSTSQPLPQLQPNAPSTTEVIEVSDIDEPAPPAPVKKEKSKAFTNSTTILDAADGTLKSGDSLKFSANSVEVMAAATAAVVAAAVTPKVELPALPTSIGERRPHLVSEILKKPGLDVASAATAPPPTTSTTSPLTPVGGKDGASISPFLAEFSRYLTHTGATPHPPLSSMGRPSLQQQMAQQASQLQSKTVSSTSITSLGGRVPQEDKRGRRSPLDDKKLSSPNRLPPIQWQMEAMLGMADNKAARKQQQHASGLPSPVSAHQSNSSSVDTQQARLQKMTALLMGQDSSSAADSLPQQQQPPLRKTKGDIVRDQILSQIQAEIDASNAKSGGGVSASRQTGEVAGKRTSQGMVTNRPPNSLPSPTASTSLQRLSPPTAHHVSRQSPPVPPAAHQASSSSRQSPVPAHQHSPNNGNTPRQQTGAPGVCRQQPSPSLAASSHQAPTPVRNHQAAVAGVGPAPTSGKQQAVVSPNQGGGNGAGVLPQGSNRSMLSTFQSRKVPPSSTPLQQLSPSASSPASTRAVAPVRPGVDPASSMRKASLLTTLASSPVPVVRPVTATQRKANPSPSGSPVSLPQVTLPFQRNPTNTSPQQQQSPFKAGAAGQGQVIKVSSAGQGQNMKVGVSLGQNVKAAVGQNVKTGTVSPGQTVKINTEQAQNLRGLGLVGQVSAASQRVSPTSQNQILMRKSSPTSPASQSQRNTSATTAASITAVHSSSVGGGLDSAQKISQKLLGGAANSGNSGLSRGQVLSQQIEREVRKSATAASGVQNNRGSPGQWSGVGQTASPTTAIATKAAAAAAQLTILTSSQGSNPASATHSTPPVPGNKMMAKVPRPQDPGNVAGKTLIRPTSSPSGIPGIQGSGLDPQAVVTSGLFNHRPVFRPLHSQTPSPGSLNKEPPRPTQGFGN